MGDVCTIFSGFAFKSEFFNQEGTGMPLIRIRDVNTGLSGTFYSGDYDEKYIVGDGDLLIGMDGDFRATRWSHGSALLNQRVCRVQGFSDEVLPGFIFQIVRDALRKIQDATSSSTVKHLSAAQLRDLLIPVPSIEVQHSAVRLLDQIESMVSDLNAGLPGEIDARRKQYEYYRNQLLTFKELVA